MSLTTDVVLPPRFLKFPWQFHALPGQPLQVAWPADLQWRLQPSSRAWVAHHGGDFENEAKPLLASMIFMVPCNSAENLQRHRDLYRVFDFDDLRRPICGTFGELNLKSKYWFIRLLHESWPHRAGAACQKGNTASSNAPTQDNCREKVKAKAPPVGTKVDKASYPHRLCGRGGQLIQRNASSIQAAWSLAKKLRARFGQESPRPKIVRQPRVFFFNTGNTGVRSWNNVCAGNARAEVMFKLILHRQAQQVPTRNEGGDALIFVEEKQSWFKASPGMHLPKEERLLCRKSIRRLRRWRKWDERNTSFIGRSSERSRRRPRESTNGNRIGPWTMRRSWSPAARKRKTSASSLQAPKT